MYARLCSGLDIFTQDGETFDSLSKITFTPTYEENDKEVECHAINDVMDEAIEYKIDLLIECEFL